MIQERCRGFWPGHASDRRPGRMAEGKKKKGHRHSGFGLSFVVTREWSRRPTYQWGRKKREGGGKSLPKKKKKRTTRAERGCRSD